MDVDANKRLLEQGMELDGKMIYFDYLELYENAMSLIFPRDFAKLPEDLAKIKYPNRDRPEIIYSSYDTKSTLTFNLYHIPMTSIQTHSAASQFKQMIKKMQPMNVFSEVQEEEIGERKISWFHYTGYAVDGQHFNILYFTPLLGECLVGSLNCALELKEQWLKTVVIMMRSIREQKQGE